MKKKITRYVLCATSLGLILALSGCANGIGDTVSLVKNAERAKTSAERLLDNSNTEKVVVGTTADPNYVAENKLAVQDFQVSCNGVDFTASWDVDTGYEKVRVQIFADTDMDGLDGTKIASFDAELPEDTKSFQYKMLEDGEYYCYIKVTAEDTSSVTAYSSIPVTVKNEQPETFVENVEIQVADGMVCFTWDAEPGLQYAALLLSAEDETTVLAKVITEEGTATIPIPEDHAAIYAAVAVYDKDQIGAFEPQLITLVEQDTEVEENE